MKVTREEDDRMMDSRQKLFSVMMMALGSYVEQEAKKKDEWRDKSWGECYAHLKHEVIEIGRSKTKTAQLHNCLDAINLAAIMAAKIIFEKP